MSARLAAIRFSRTSVWTGFKILLAFGLLALLLTRISIAEIATVLTHVLPGWLIVSFVAFCIQVGAMARRYWLLINKVIPFHALLGLVILQTVLGNLVATSAGAVSYVAVLRGKYRVRATQSISSLVIARLGDALVLWVALGFAVWRVWEQVTPLHWLVIGLLTALGGLLGVCALVMILRERLVRHFDWLCAKMKLDGVSPFKQFMESLRALALISGAELIALGIPVLVWSITIFALNFGFAFANLQMFQVPITWEALLFIVCLTQILSLVPIQVFGGLGVYEVTAVLIFSLFGVDAAMIASTLLGLRVIFYAFNVLLLAYLPLEGRFAQASDALETNSAGL